MNHHGQLDEENLEMIKSEKIRKKHLINTRRGHFKSYNMPIIIQSAENITFYCVGNKAELERLFRDLTHIGKKRSQGFGEVKKVVLESVNYDWSLFNNGSPMRFLPFEYYQKKKKKKVDIMVQLVPIRPSYWNTAKAELCVYGKHDLLE